ncbi:MAG TPA: 50S ribosomal protein L3 [Mollicutes bacterium]|nr:50S ribosomal protein L3 [Mollicutes bacterium]
MKGILGRKIGMTQVFTEEGKLIPVTVIEAEPNIVTQIKSKQTDGYDAIQLGFSTKREKLSNKPERGHVAKANTTPKRFLREIRGVDISKYTLGQEIKVDIFEVGEVVDVTGTSKGKGFQGVIKRYNLARGPMGHGSQYHRGVGSMGSMRPMRVFKGKKLPGHMGHETVTIQNLEVVSVDLENNIILIKGNVPGAKKSLVIIKTSTKKPTVKREAPNLKTYVEEVSETTEPTDEVVVEDTVTEETVAEDANEDALASVNEESSQESEEQ